MAKRTGTTQNRRMAILPKAVLVLLVLMLAVTACSGCILSDLPVSGQTVTQIEKAPLPDIDDVTIQDNDHVYRNDDEDSVVTMYLTVRKGNKADGINHTWEEINKYSIFDYEEMGVERYRVEGILQVGNEDGPVAGELGFGLKIPNAYVQIRGATTTRSPQKSYKIELKNDNETWRDQTTIALNKHVFEGLRFRNKLCFDLIKEIPNMISLRTQFVHLYVKDETKPEPDTAFVDYGLFTQVEQPNKRFLKNHGLDSEGHFYKLKFFEFHRYEDVIKLKTDPGYDLAAFEQILEVKGSDDHTKLINMLTELNDYSKPIDEVFEAYFNADNYFTWLAFNILVGNVDTQTQNYYLYSPLNSNTWYFIPWDYDGALSKYENILFRSVASAEVGYETGISNYWGNVIHNRVLREEKYLKLLDEKINELRGFLTKERIDAKVRTYRSVVEKYVYAMPDVMYARLTPEQYDLVATTLYDEVERNYQHYIEDLQKPKPFFLDDPVEEADGLRFQWDVAYSHQRRDITYTFELAGDYNFQDVIHKETGLSFPSVKVPKPPAGQYFYRVLATDEAGYTQYAMEYYYDSKSLKHYGVKCFYVLHNGEVVPYEAY